MLKQSDMTFVLGFKVQIFVVADLSTAFGD